LKHYLHRKPCQGEIDIPPLQGFIDKLAALPVALPQAIALRPFGAIESLRLRGFFKLLLNLEMGGSLFWIRVARRKRLA
jgi:hypothetical protein